jgi:hypothetical protein
MQDQFTLFDDSKYDINEKLANLRNLINEGWHPFTIDIVQKYAILKKVSCSLIMNTYENYEQHSNNSEN